MPTTASEKAKDQVPTRTAIVAAVISATAQVQVLSRGATPMLHYRLWLRTFDGMLANAVADNEIHGFGGNR